MLSHLIPAFTIGLFATLNPCVLPLYPGYLAYLAAGGNGTTRHLGVMVLAGVMTMMLAIGALIAGLSKSFSEFAAIAIQPLGVAMMFLMGLFLIVDMNPFARFPVLSTPGSFTRPHARAFIYGLLFAPMIMPCAGPLVIGIFTLSLGVAGFVEQLLFFVIFGLGFGAPLLVLSFLPKDWSERMLRQIAMRSRIIGIISGVTLIVFAIWNLPASLELLSLVM